MSAHGCPRCGAICGCSSTGCAHRCPPTSKPGGLHDHIVKQRNDLVDENDRLADENAALRKSQAAYVAELRRADETIGALRKRVEELERDIRIHDVRSYLSRCTPAERSEIAFYADVEGFRVRAEKAERERDETQARCDEDRAEWVKDMERVREINAKLQADLDAALNWIEHDEDESIPPAGLWQRVKALLESQGELLPLAQDAEQYYNNRMGDCACYRYCKHCEAWDKKQRAAREVIARAERVQKGEV